MAAIPVILNGVFTSASGSTTGVFQGTMAYADLGVGGGPILPDKPPSGGGEHPEHPIYYPPGTAPSDPHPEHPIVLPPPVDPPIEPPVAGDPRWQWGYVYSTARWEPVYVPGPTDPSPHAG